MSVPFLGVDSVGRDEALMFTAVSRFPPESQQRKRRWLLVCFDKIPRQGMPLLLFALPSRTFPADISDDL